MVYSQNIRGKTIGFVLCAMLFTVPVRPMLPPLNRDTAKAALIAGIGVGTLVGGMWCYYSFGPVGRALLAKNNEIQVLKKFASTVTEQNVDVWTPAQYDNVAQ